MRILHSAGEWGGVLQGVGTKMAFVLQSLMGDFLNIGLLSTLSYTANYSQQAVYKKTCSGLAVEYN